MKLIDLLSLLAWPGSTLVDLYEAADDDGLCLWTGVAGNVPAELHNRNVELFEPNAYGLNVHLI